MNSTIPFQVPTEFASRIADGSVSRFGTILKDTGTGRILGHLQETGLAQKVLSCFSTNPASSISSLISAGSSIYANVQLSQIKQMVESLKLLQFANLGAAAIGIGVSVTGFVILNRRLHQIENRIDQLSSLIDQRFEKLAISSLRAHHSQVRGLISQAEQSFSLSNPAREWHRIAGLMAQESAFFQGELSFLLNGENFSTDLFLNLFQSFSLCNNGRIECMTLANELEYAWRIACDISDDYNNLFDRITPTDLLDKIYGVRDWDGDKLEHPVDHQANAQSLVAGIRDAQDACATRPLLIESLIDQGISGRQFIEDLAQETNQALVILPVTSSG